MIIHLNVGICYLRKTLQMIGVNRSSPDALQWAKNTDYKCLYDCETKFFAKLLQLEILQGLYVLIVCSLLNIGESDMLYYLIQKWDSFRRLPQEKIGERLQTVPLPFWSPRHDCLQTPAFAMYKSVKVTSQI